MELLGEAFPRFSLSAVGSFGRHDRNLKRAAKRTTAVVGAFGQFVANLLLATKDKKNQEGSEPKKVQGIFLWLFFERRRSLGSLNRRDLAS